MLATFGGGLERFKEMVTANTSGAMPGARPVVTWEARLALDRLTQLIKSASLAVDKPVPVLVLPEEGDEITIVQQRVSGGEETLIRVPITIIRDIVNAAMRPGAGGGKPLP